MSSDDSDSDDSDDASESDAGLELDEEQGSSTLLMTAQSRRPQLNLRGESPAGVHLATRESDYGAGENAGSRCSDVGGLGKFVRYLKQGRVEVVYSGNVGEDEWVDVICEKVSRSKT